MGAKAPNPLPDEFRREAVFDAKAAAEMARKVGGVAGPYLRGIETSIRVAASNGQMQLEVRPTLFHALDQITARVVAEEVRIMLRHRGFVVFPTTTPFHDYPGFSVSWSNADPALGDKHA